VTHAPATAGDPALGSGPLTHDPATAGRQATAGSGATAGDPATGGDPAGWRWREGGGASLVALALVAFVLLAGMLAVDVGALAAARAAAQTAADMAALAALAPGGGAAGAAGIAAANGSELASCDCSAVQAVVTVRRRVPLAPTGLSVWVTARARAVLAGPPAAGPPDPGPPDPGPPDPGPRRVPGVWRSVGGGQPAQHPQEPGGDGALVGGGGLAGLLQRQRDPQPAPLRRRERGPHLVERLAEQVRQGGERQAHLRPGGRARQHPPGAFPRAGDAVAPQGRLADARLTLQHQRAKGRPRRREEPLDLRELRPSTPNTSAGAAVAPCPSAGPRPGWLVAAGFAVIAGSVVAGTLKPAAVDGRGPAVAGGLAARAVAVAGRRVRGAAWRCGDPASVAEGP
jgi:hypothetical protein